MKQPTEQLIQVGDIEVRFFVDGSHSSGAFDAFEFLVPAGAKVPAAHYHEAVDEFLFGIEGVLTVTVDGQRHDLGAGNRCFIPRGVVHHFSNEQAGQARALSIWSPALIGPQFFQEIAAVMNAGGPPDLGRIKEAMHTHGLTPARMPTPASA